MSISQEQKSIAPRRISELVTKDRQPTELMARYMEVTTSLINDLIDRVKSTEDTNNVMLGNIVDLTNRIEALEAE